MNLQGLHFPPTLSDTHTGLFKSTTSFAATFILQNVDFSKSAAARRTRNIELIASPGRSYFGFSTHFAMHSAGT